MDEESSSVLRIRPEGPGDEPAIRRVNELAFEGSTEADLVDKLRTAGAIVLSMVALDDDDEIVAHALVSPVTVVTEEVEVSLLGLGPVAVLPSRQGQGIGMQLIETSLEWVREYGHAGVVVVGDADYYSRFGFIPASRWGLRWEADAPEEVFLAMELSPGRLSGVKGTVRYRPEFSPPPSL